MKPTDMAMTTWPVLTDKCLKPRFGNGKGVVKFVSMSFQLKKKMIEPVDNFAGVDILAIA